MLASIMLDQEFSSKSFALLFSFLFVNVKVSFYENRKVNIICFDISWSCEQLMQMMNDILLLRCNKRYELFANHKCDACVFHSYFQNNEFDRIPSNCILLFWFLSLTFSVWNQNQDGKWIRLIILVLFSRYYMRINTLWFIARFC